MKTTVFAQKSPSLIAKFTIMAEKSHDSLPEIPPDEDRRESTNLHRVPTLDASFDASFAPAGRPAVKSTVPWFRDREYLLGGWTNASIWRSAVSFSESVFPILIAARSDDLVLTQRKLCETVGTCSLVFTSGQIGATLMNYEIEQLGAYIGISNVILLSTFIYATAPASGGHLNPLITFSAMLAGICPFARGKKDVESLLEGE